MKKILSILFLIFLLTGCVKYDLTTGLKSDKSFSITLIDAISKEYSESMDLSASKAEYEKLGFEVKEYSDDKYVGLKLIKNFNSIDEVSSSNCSGYELTDLLESNVSKLTLFKSSKKDSTTTYIANFTYDLTVEQKEDEQEIDYSEYTDTMYFKYTFSFPENITIINENADEKINNNHTLSWNMKYGELKNINFTFSIDDNNVTEKKEDDSTTSETPDSEEITSPENIDETETNEIKEEVRDKNTIKSANPFEKMIALLVAIGLIFGIVAYKIKTKADSKKPTIQMTHSKPPKNGKK